MTRKMAEKLENIKGIARHMKTVLGQPRSQLKAQVS